MKKTQIFIFAFNRPDLLEKQISCFKKFFIGEYELNVVLDCRDEKYLNFFEKICKNQNIKFYKHISESPEQTPSMNHGIAVTWAYREIILKNHKNDYVLIVDHDMFLIDYLDIEFIMKDFDVCGCTQFRGEVKYVWPGLTILNVENIKDIEFDFLPCAVNGQILDTGGGTYKLLCDNNIKFMGTGVDYPEEYKGIDIKDEKVTCGYGYELHFDNKFLHSRNASNWHNQYQVGDRKKTRLLFQMLSDILDEKDKSYLEIVISRYSENLDWVKPYQDYATIYNKGGSIKGAIALKNIGREAHTYLYHIVNNYDNLANYTCFFQGDPMNPHSPRFHLYLDHILNSNELLPEFFWISERIVEGDFEYEREPYHRIFPNIKYAYEKVFGKGPEIKKFIFGSGAQFCVSRNRIKERPIEFYKNILDIFEHDPGDELDELSIKLLGNSGIDEKFIPLNPELGYHMETFWGLIFNEV